MSHGKNTTQNPDFFLSPRLLDPEGNQISTDPVAENSPDGANVLPATMLRRQLALLWINKIWSIMST